MQPSLSTCTPTLSRYHKACLFCIRYLQYHVTVVPRDVEGIAALRSSSRRFRFGAVGDPPGRGIGWAHVVVSMLWQRYGFWVFGVQV